MTRCATTGRGATVSLRTGPHVDEAWGAAYSSMDPQDAIDLIRAAIASGKPISVHVRIEGAETRAGARSGAERMRALRAKRRDYQRHETSQLVTKRDDSPLDPLNQNGPSVLGSEELLSRESAIQAADVPACGRARGAKSDEVTRVTVTSRRTKRGPLWHFVPDDWAGPNDAHRRAAVELRLAVAAEEAKFRLHEFKDAKSDADRAFHRWLKTARELLDKGGSGGGRREVPTQKTIGFDYSKYYVNGAK